MIIRFKKIKNAIQSAGYSTENPKEFKFIGIMIAVAAVVLLGINTGITIWNHN
ncbi:hypothetical protein QFZ28_001947 [Neobacillus niacini]|uniref:hypothetical protein n=1 Tax=Neobacillus niacini TaxID=86668 RepID=UPI00277E699B|nr:hypothetical protein [Neobacillus niacini]MDQ1001547.1 hypothetical protein [Neobacillus niacini]